MAGKLAEQCGVTPLGRFVGIEFAGCDPDEMGIGPVFAVPRLFETSWGENGRYWFVGVE